MSKRFNPGSILFFCVAVLFMISSCSGGGGGSTGSQTVFSAKLVRSADCADLESRIKSELKRRYQRQNTYYDYMVMTGGPAAADSGGSVQSGDSGSGTVPHSETNVQEPGVDEGDMVKTDGSYIYLARGSHFIILSANPPEQSSIISDTDIQEPINELYLSGSRVAVITNKIGDQTIVGGAMPVMSGPVYSTIYFYDVTDPSSPVLTQQYDFPGSLQGSRRIGGTFYLVTNYTIDLPSPVSPWNYLEPGNYDQQAFENAADQALAENLRMIDEATLDELLPVYSSTVAGNTSTYPAAACGDVYVPEFGNGTDLSLVASIDTSGQSSAVSTSAVLSSWGKIYMNTESLYLASDNNWLWIEPVLGASQPEDNPQPLTALYKFAISGTAGRPVYRGSAVVHGWLNDRFSMGEYMGYMRIGTTVGGWWGDNISNQLTVLAEDGGELKETGKITGIAPGERIYSMRFDGDRGYMVTFRQTDPLHTLDLRDPSNPAIAGAIEVGGFATYIHPIGTRLLTIGQSTDQTGLVTGNKLQLFDVSDLSNPVLLGDYKLGPGWSDALYDPHAFQYYETLGVLNIPYFSWDVNGGYSSGLNVFNISEPGISLKGIIPSTVVTSGYPYEDTVDRSVIIGNDIFSIAHRSVTVAGADQLDIKKVVTLPESYNYIYPMMAQ